jgi:hypothetical protein
MLQALDLTPSLHEGQTTITVRAQNGPWSCSPGACTYADAPAGVVFGGFLAY